jgi:uncharacterized membrane protein YhaH (DUF805 family)
MSLQALREILAKNPNSSAAFVWRDGFSSWQIAGDVQELELPTSNPPPLPPVRVAQQLGENTSLPPPKHRFDTTNVVRLWFDVEGRINRAKYWLVSLSNLAMFMAGVFAVILTDSSLVARGVLILITIIVVTSECAVSVKRLHDREMSAGWLLIFFVLPPIPSILFSLVKSDGRVLRGDEASGEIVLQLVSYAIYVWAIIELGCLRGTSGANKYGPDPLGQNMSRRPQIRSNT